MEIILNYAISSSRNKERERQKQRDITANINAYINTGQALLVF